MTNRPTSPIYWTDFRSQRMSATPSFGRRRPLDLRSFGCLSWPAYFFNAIGVGEYGGRLGAVRDRRRVEQVVGAAFQTYGGVDPHPTPLDKAAMLLRGITHGHPFNDGNKRTGFLVSAFYLKIMGHAPPREYQVDAVVALCVGVSMGTLRDIGIIASEIRRLWDAELTGV